MTIECLDVAGIGIGPFNLSLAALLATVPEVHSRFFERRAAFAWHPGMLLPGTSMQTSFLKDLVTPVSPTSPFSFLAYLVAKGRFFRFANAEFPRVRRAEFADYMRWVADQLPNLSFQREVTEIDFDGPDFVLSFTDGRYHRATNLVVATGLSSHAPPWAERHLGSGCLHSQRYMDTDFSVADRRVVIVGGGQSGAEIFLDLLSCSRGTPREITWISRRQNLDPLDETAFTNEYFTPDYVRHFHRLPEDRKPSIVEGQKLAGDGVSPRTLSELSQRLYEEDFLKARGVQYAILTHRDVRAMTRDRGAYSLEMHNAFDHADEVVSADVVILATGYRYVLPPCLASMESSIERDDEGNIKLAEDYSVSWSGPPSRRIYMQNAGRHSHGIADPQLSLAAWRSAVIVNSLLGREIYPTTPAPTPIRWSHAPGAERSPSASETHPHLLTIPPASRRSSWRATAARMAPAEDLSDQIELSASELKSAE